MARYRPLPQVKDVDPTQRVTIDNLASIASFKTGDLQNFRFEIQPTSSGKNVFTKKRLGYATLGNDVGNLSPLGIFGYKQTDGTSEIFASWNKASNAEIYKLVTATWTAQSISSLTNNKQFNAEQDGDDMYFSNGTESWKKYNGSSWSSLSGGTPMSGSSNVAKYLKLNNRMMFAANTVNNPQRLFISSVGDSETFSGSNVYDFHTEITGLMQLGQFIIVGTKKEVFRVLAFSPSTAQIKKISDNPVLSHKSMAQVVGSVFFISKDGVYATDGQISKRIAWGSLKDIWDNSINNSRLTQASASFFDGVYHLSITTGSATTNDAVLIFDPRFPDVWIKDTGIQCHDWAQYDPSSDIPNLYFQEATDDSVVYQMYSGNTDNSTAITWKYTTGGIDNKEPNLIKKYKKTYLNVKAIGDLNLSVWSDVDDFGFSLIPFGSTQHNFINMTGSGATWGNFVWGDGTKWGSSLLVISPENRGRLVDKGKIIRIRWGDSHTSTPTEVYNLQFFFIPIRIK